MNRHSIFTPSGLHIRAREDGSESRELEGYAIVFNEASAALYESDREIVREVIAPDAVTRDLLDMSNIVLTMFHDNELVLGRSKNGIGSLSYEIDERGVKFRCEMPQTIDGDKALALVRRGDLDGCSFAFTTRYHDSGYVTNEQSDENGRVATTYIVRKMTGIYDFTLTHSPAYPATSVQARELAAAMRSEPAPAVVTPTEEEQARQREAVDRQLEMLRVAAMR